MKIVDAHVHIWASGTPSPAHRQITEFTGEALLAEMDDAGVDAGIIQPPAWDRGSNEVAVAAAERHPDRFAILGWFDLDAPDAKSKIAGWTDRPGMLGLRFTFMDPRTASWPTDGTIDWLWPAAEEAGLPLALAAANFLPKVGAIAARHPDLKLLIDHLGMPLRQTDDAALTNLSQLVALSQYPNIAIKATAAPGSSTEPYPYRNLHNYLETLFDSYGPSRMFWGTDITRMSCSYRQCVTMFTEELKWLKGKDLELVMGKAVCDWIGWDLGA